MVPPRVRHSDRRVSEQCLSKRSVCPIGEERNGVPEWLVPRILLGLVSINPVRTEYSKGRSTAASGPTHPSHRRATTVNSAQRPSLDVVCQDAPRRRTGRRRRQSTPKAERRTRHGKLQPTGQRESKSLRGVRNIRQASAQLCAVFFRVVSLLWVGCKDAAAVVCRGQESNLTHVHPCTRNDIGAPAHSPRQHKGQPTRRLPSNNHGRIAAPTYLPPPRRPVLVLAPRLWHRTSDSSQVQTQQTVHALLRLRSRTDHNKHGWFGGCTDRPACAANTTASCGRGQAGPAGAGAGGKSPRAKRPL
jgi:hypothetical protein